MDRILIIAEAGVNHNGDINLAHRLIDAAKNAGADIVKFQTGKPENVISRFAEKAEYQKRNTGCREGQLDMVRKVMLSFEAFTELKKHCEAVGIGFLSTPFDLESIDFLQKLGCDMWKIPSGEVTNYPYLARIAETGKDIILSTGMCRMDEIDAAYHILHEKGGREISLLHCTTQYPAPFESVNLRAMLTLRDKFQCPVGYSDHTVGAEVSVAAAALGASILEKHFTLDRGMEGPDHKASLEPDELTRMITQVRHIEVALGDGEKKPADEEIPNLTIARKSIVAKRNIRKGEIFSAENITTKRPGNGISPMLWNEVMGMKAIKDFSEDDLIEL